MASEVERGEQVDDRWHYDLDSRGALSRIEVNRIGTGWQRRELERALIRILSDIV